MIVTPAFAASEGSETHSETGTAHDGGHDSGFPPFDSTSYPSQLLWLAITFGLFYLFLKRMVLPRISSILEVRRDHIAQDLDQAARMKGEADEAIAAYEQELADARSKASAIAQEARDGAKAEAQEQRSVVEAELDRKLEAAEARIADIKSTAMQDVGSIAEDTAATIIKELIGGTLAKADVAAAVKSVRG
jgi:F-type H+-transporting ATPase subunit b